MFGHTALMLALADVDEETCFSRLSEKRIIFKSGKSPAAVANAEAKRVRKHRARLSRQRSLSIHHARARDIGIEH